MLDNNTVIEGTVKFRDGKKWKSRWCIMRKISPVADCLHLQLYRDSKDRYKQGQTKASLSLQHFLGVESGFTLDKESNTIAIICQDVTVILAFDTRERLIQWQVKISNNLGEDQQFLIQITSAPPKAKIASGPARLHVIDQKFCITVGVPPRLVGFWEIGFLRRYGVVEGRFCFEGGSRCGKGEGLHVCVTDQGDEITHAFQLAAQGKLTSRRRPVTRKMSAMDSPRKQLHSRTDIRMSDISCTESFQQQQLVQLVAGDLNRSVYGDNMCCGCSASECGRDSSRHPSSEDLLCPCRMHGRSGSPFWSSAESAAGHHHADLDSNYGCGDTASVSELHDPHYLHQESGWPLVGADGIGYDRQAGPVSLERCASCIGKLGGPSMSRSSTLTNTNTPTGGPNSPFNPAWTMDNATNIAPVCHLHNRTLYPVSSAGSSGSGCDRLSLYSHGSGGSGGSSGHSEYSVPRNTTCGPIREQCLYDRPRTLAGAGSPPPVAPPVIPPKSPKRSSQNSSLEPIHSPKVVNPPNSLPINDTCKCRCCPPSRPPKPPQKNDIAITSSDSSAIDSSPTKKKVKKPPMPLPTSPPKQLPITVAPTHQWTPVCTCHHPQMPSQQHADSSAFIGPYENYDVPKSVLGNSSLKEIKEDIKPCETYSRCSQATLPTEEYYDTPKNIKECLASSVNDAAMNLQYGNYDIPPTAMTVRKPCGCVIKYAKKATVVAASSDSIRMTKMVVDSDERSSASLDCPCRRMMCWAENWMTLPYCRRGNGKENTAVSIHKVKLSGEGKMPVVNPSGEIAIYATVDKSKKTNRRLASHAEAEERVDCSCPLGDVSQHADNCIKTQARPDTSTSCDSSNYVNVEPSVDITDNTNEAVPLLTNSGVSTFDGASGLNYENIDFAQSLENYENSKDVLNRAGITKQDVGEFSEKDLEKNEISGEPLSYTVNDGIKYCNKCGHACHWYQDEQPPAADSKTPDNKSSVYLSSHKQDDYLMMEPSKNMKTPTEHLSNQCKKVSDKNFPGYLPMLPIPNSSNKLDSCKSKLDQISSNISAEKSASTPSLTGPTVDRSRKRCDSEFPRIPGSAVMILNHSGNSSYKRGLSYESSDDTRKHYLLNRKRSSSADSSRYLDEEEDNDSTGMCEESLSLRCATSDHCVPSESHSLMTTPIDLMEEVHGEPFKQDCDEKQNVNSEKSEDINAHVIEDCIEVGDNIDDGSSSSSSLRTLVRECLVDEKKQLHGCSQNLSIHIRRSSSVPSKSGKNRDSSSSNDSGVSTSSLKHHRADFSDFELPLTTAMSTIRHHHAVSKLQDAATNCLHASLPRRSKSVDPLREITFQFSKVEIPAKSSSAEAEVPIFPTKGSKGYASPGTDGTMSIPYMDSRSTSSGTSDMSDYIETLSLSSHSSSETANAIRLGCLTSTLRPRSGKEYQLIDRSIIEADIKSLTGAEKQQHQLHDLSNQYTNITPVFEKSESPSPGYMSSSPGER